MNKVLIVNDAAFMRVTIKGMLEKSCYIVVSEAADGAKSLDCILQVIKKN